MKNIPTEKYIVDTTRQHMKTNGTFDASYNRILGVYASTLHQFYILQKEWADGGYQTYIEIGESSIKKNPVLEQLNVLRKDVIQLSDRLMLNPKTAKEAVKLEQPQKESAFSKLLKQSGV